MNSGAIHQVARSAVEWLTAPGARTLERLAELADHYADTYGLQGEARTAAHAEARAIAQQRGVQLA